MKITSLITLIITLLTPLKAKTEDINCIYYSKMHVFKEHNNRLDYYGYYYECEPIFNDYYNYHEDTR